jgi:hypothetical protein
MSPTQCEKCHREFLTQEELDKHTKIYAYAETHDLKGLEETVSFLLYTRQIDKKNLETINKHYSALERQYYDLIEKTKPKLAIEVRSQ